MATTPTDGFGTGRLFLADSRLAFALLNHARYQVLGRFFGVSRKNANVFTVILVLTGMNVALEKTTRIVRAPAAAGVTRGDAAIGLGAVRAGVASVVGPGTADTPLLGTLLTIGVVGGLAAPGLRRAARAIRETEHRIREQRISMYRAAMRAASPESSD